MPLLLKLSPLDFARGEEKKYFHENFTRSDNFNNPFKKIKKKTPARE